jgi:hypothetical protein
MIIQNSKKRLIKKNQIQSRLIWKQYIFYKYCTDRQYYYKSRDITYVCLFLKIFQKRGGWGTLNKLLNWSGLTNRA